MFAVQRPASSTTPPPSACHRPPIATGADPLSELGRVIDSVENDKLAAWSRTRRRHPGDLPPARHQHNRSRGRVKKLLPTFRAEVPEGVGINVMYDRSNTTGIVEDGGSP